MFPPILKPFLIALCLLLIAAGVVWSQGTTVSGPLTVTGPPPGSMCLGMTAAGQLACEVNPLTIGAGKFIFANGMVSINGSAYQPFTRPSSCIVIFSGPKLTSGSRVQLSN